LLPQGPHQLEALSPKVLYTIKVVKNQVASRLIQEEGQAKSIHTTTLDKLAMSETPVFRKKSQGKARWKKQEG
jgi:hypothetical protein